MKFLTGLLNSRLIYFWLYHKGKRQGEQLQVDRAPLTEIPIINSENKEVAEIVDSIIILNKKLASLGLEREKELIKKQILALEKRIDNIIYKLYGLTEEEVGIVGGEK